MRRFWLQSSIDGWRNRIYKFCWVRQKSTSGRSWSSWCSHIPCIPVNSTGPSVKWSCCASLRYWHIVGTLVTNTMSVKWPSHAWRLRWSWWGIHQGYRWRHLLASDLVKFKSEQLLSIIPTAIATYHHYWSTSTVGGKTVPVWRVNRVLKGLDSLLSFVLLTLEHKQYYSHKKVTTILLFFRYYTIYILWCAYHVIWERVCAEYRRVQSTAHRGIICRYEIVICPNFWWIYICWWWTFSQYVQRNRRGLWDCVCRRGALLRVAG